jgi:hypothetical protein
MSLLNSAKSKYTLVMKTMLRVLLVFGLTMSSISTGHAAEELQIVQVERVEVSSLSVDTSKPFKFLLSAVLISEKTLGVGSGAAAGSIGVACGHSGAFDAKTDVSSIGQDRYKFTCEISSTPLSGSEPAGFQEVSILMLDTTNTAVVPKTNFTFKKEKTDSFGTKTTLTLPLSTALGGWGNMKFYPRIGWMFGLAVNPPTTYVFPKFPIENKSFVVFSSNETKYKTTYSLNTKKRTLNVKCPSSVPSFSLGGAKAKTSTFLLVGNNVVGGPSWNYNFPGVPGTTQMVSCVSQTTLPNHNGQIIGYSESAPVSVKFPK